ncbi:MAG: outer membrane lipoprotein-sorting protein [Proteobacteria bacterium]|nr:outer membrane lipoprotein-sorting protein [Pseudomonadota bacterium]
MKRKIEAVGRWLGLLGTFCLFAASSALAETPEEKGRRLMEQIDQRPVMEKMISETVLHIYDSQGKKIFSKKSRSATFAKDFRDHKKRLSRSLSYFYSPADDKGNGALMIEIPDADDNQWLYLKGLRKPKRVVGSDKSSSFMGSDFSNGDIGARDIEESNYTWLGTEKVAFKKKKLTVEKIQGVFKDEQLKENYGYSKTIVWMHVKSGLPLKMEYYNLNGQLAKKARMVSFSVKKNRDGKKIFMVTSLEMKNVLKGTKTVMKMKKIKVGKAAAKIKPAIFKVEYLTRKWW